VEKIIDDMMAMSPLILFTLFAVMYHLGHKEYDKLRGK